MSNEPGSIEGWIEAMRELGATPGTVEDIFKSDDEYWEHVGQKFAMEYGARGVLAAVKAVQKHHPLPDWTKP